MPIYEFEGKRPVIGDGCFIHPQAVLIGSVEIGNNCYIGAGSVIRGDVGKIIIGAGCSIQDNSVIHVDPDTLVIIEDFVLIGHSAIVHGPCLIKQHAVIGMGAIVSINCEIEAESLLGAGSLLPPGQVINYRKMALGNPAKTVRELSNEQVLAFQSGIREYGQLVNRSISTMKLIDTK
ncbi:MAG: gamma carbonic anhydrase family protein [Syntrophomonadaceae bacterium]